MYSIGIDIGYSAVKMAVIDSSNKVICNKYRLHKGHIKVNLLEIIEELASEYDLNNIKYGALTGNGSKKIVKVSSLSFIDEIPAMVEAGLKFNKNIKSIIHIGGQGAKFIAGINKDNKSQIEVAMNSNCAAGTGSFLEEQISRLNLKLQDYSLYASKATKIPRIAGRCSVFAKTDITHHQQEGTSVEDILLGLAYAMVRNYKGSVVRKLPIGKPIMFTGGVAYNQGIIIAIKDIFKLKDNELVVPKNAINSVAIGAASIALTEKKLFSIKELLNILQIDDFEYQEVSTVKLKPLNTYNIDDAKDKHICKVVSKVDSRQCYLGIDIGSTSTNLVLMNKAKEILAYEYLKTYGKPLETIKKGLKLLMNKCDNNIQIIGTGITGSGRYMIGKLLKVDIIKDEITAQAKAAITIDSSVDTIFEIGGQDSKYISLQNAVVTDFQMNKICAAGTGSFIEEQANKFNIPINDFGKVALNGLSPIDLGERCTVFMETSIASSISKGAKIQDIASGLCYSIVQNYLNKVVGKKKIGKKIFFQGGVAYNQGVVNAFRNLIGDKIVVPPFFSVTGAYGVAIIASEEMVCETQFVGFNKDIKLEVNDNRIISKQKQVTEFDKELKKIIFKDYDKSIADKKQTVGIPRALFTFGMFPLYNEFFKELGFNVLLSSESNENTVRLCQEYSMEETCFPMKLLNGHVAELIEKKVDYIFIPDLYTADHPESKSRKNYGCAYMQLAFKMINQAMELEKKGIYLLSPTLAPNLGTDFMQKSFLSLGKVLNRSSEEILRALNRGFAAVKKFKTNLEQNAKNKIAHQDENKLTFVIISKIYGVLDPVLNTGVAKKLESMGYNVILFTDLVHCDIYDDYPNMYWPFSQHILAAAKYIKNKANMYAVFLTHHGCGPDSVVSHYFRKEMQAKPYLNIEVDEHSSNVGIITRVEAFVNSLGRVQNINYVMDVNKNNNNNKPAKLYLQYMYPYSDLLKETLKTRDINADVLPLTCKKSLAIGRKYTLGQEYYSLTMLLGDVFKKVNEFKDVKQQDEDNIDFLIFRTEGSEVEGQYSQMVKTILAEEQITDIGIVEPFIEDLVNRDEREFTMLCRCLLAGDIIMLADKNERHKYLLQVVELVKKNELDLNQLISFATEIAESLKTKQYNKKIFVTGEATIIFNDFLNNYTLKNLEDQNHKIIYNSMSEYMWMIWHDSIRERQDNTQEVQKRLNNFKKMIKSIALCFNCASPFEKELDSLTEKAQKSMGYYAGANGRYRAAKICSELNSIDGIITVNSIYENTGVALNVVQRGFDKENNLAILNLTFDGNDNENDKSKLSSFLYYL
ncbi:CoA activase [Clostridium sp. 'deep sea']|uniref:acyl-CoA dehydratase activase n=1 Tax=Clostridium sp. 'deep sea' TaxID=2779445 RepID=UPI00189695B3|nr:acyl-CoA dehydratase activase [Clostridium sp. 'deep sea']QOR35230.1 CoA activase [Clostridium sp. 'deep sea']